MMVDDGLGLWGSEKEGQASRRKKRTGGFQVSEK